MQEARQADVRHTFLAGAPLTQAAGPARLADNAGGTKTKVGGTGHDSIGAMETSCTYASSDPADAVLGNDPGRDRRATRLLQMHVSLQANASLR